MRLIYLVLISALLYSCGSSEKESKEKKLGLIEAKGGRYYGGTFHLNESEYVKTLFPPAIKDAVSARMASMFYEGLFEYDQKTLEVKPCLVKSFDIDSTGTVYTFELKDSVLFHDDPVFKTHSERILDTDVVLFCFQNLLRKSPINSSGDILFGSIKGAEEYYLASQNENIDSELSGFEKIDRLRFRITLERPDAHFLQKLARHELLIYSPQSFYKYGLKMKDHPVGTGPFMLKSFNEGSRYILAKNPDYHQVDEYGNKLPFLDNVLVRFIQDKKVELQEFKSGNLDMIYRLPSEYLSEILEDRYEDRGGEYSKYNLQQSSEMMTQFLGFNMKSPVYNDKNLRKAISFAINRKEILDNVLMGEGHSPGNFGITPPSFEDYDSESIIGYSFNPDSALYYYSRSMHIKNKTPLKLWLNSDGNRNTQVSLAIKESLKEVLGIEVILEIVPLAVLQEKIIDGSADFFRIGWLADIPSPKSFLTIFYGKHLREESSYPNLFAYKNQAFDQLYELGMATTDLEKANKLYIASERIVMEDAIAVVLWYDEGYRLLQAYVKNFPNNPMQYRNFKDVYFKRPETLARAAF